MGASISLLEKRSNLLRAVRQFFADRNFVEVETPLLSNEIIPEQHIEPISPREGQWLQASPELHMKRLLVQGMKAIFQITRSFRAGERGRHHSPEFTLVEWYRVDEDLYRGMDLLDELCQAVLKTPPATRTSYADAFVEQVGICPHRSTTQQLAARAKRLSIDVPATMRRDDRDEWLNLLLALLVEPHLGHTAPQLLFDYPASQAALAKIETRDGSVKIAARFELYWQGVELANGYDELTDGAELRGRLEQINRHRQADRRDALPLPESLLTAMDVGLPACAGCALGFDRLVMLACGAESIDEARSFS